MAVRNLQFVLSGQDKSASKALDKVGRKADGLGGKFRGLGKAAAFGVAGGVAAATVGLVAFGKSSVDAYKEAEKSAADLAFAFEKFPKLADSNVEAFQKINEQLAKKTVFDDDATASGQAVLAQFGLTGKQIEKLTPLLQDYAAKTGQDLPAAASLLGKATMGNAKALKAVGITLPATTDATKTLVKEQDKAARTEEKLAASRDNLAMVQATLAGKEKKSAADLERLRQARDKVAKAEKKHKEQLDIVAAATKAAGKPTERFTELTEALNKQVGGFAEKQGKTAAGQAEILRNQFGELKETVGAQLLPIISRFVKYLNDNVVPAAQKLADEFAAGKGRGGELRDVLAGMRDVAKDLAPFVKAVAGHTVSFVGFLAKHPTAVATVAGGVAAYAVAMKAAAVATGLMAAINLGKLALGIGAVGTASATAAPGVTAVGGAADVNAGMVSRFGTAVSRSIGPIGAMTAALLALSEAGKLGSFNPGGDLDKLIDKMKKGDAKGALDAAWGDGLKTEFGGNRFGTRWGSKPAPAPRVVPRPGGCSQDRPGAVNPRTAVYPRRGQAAAVNVTARLQVGPRELANATTGFHSARISRGYLPAH